MADLYTSQVHLKRLLAGQATPAFTPAPEAVLKMLDPAFFPGMGALNEDEHGRLQCPVRGCGEWHGRLSHHLYQKHPTIRGSGVRTALGIPESVPLHSTATARGYPKNQPLGRANIREIQRLSAQARKITGAPQRRTAVARNFADSCPAQLQNRLEVLARKTGHSPTRVEFREEYGSALLSAVETVFGTWSAAKAACGLTLYEDSRGTPPGLLMEMLRAYFDAHGDLPSADEADKRKAAPRTPYIPRQNAVKRILGVNNWAAAMRSAVEHLGINSERYGSPARRAS